MATEPCQRTQGQLTCSSTRGLTLPSRGRPTASFAVCRPPLMSNVSPQQVQQANGASDVPAGNAVLRTRRSRAGDAPKCREPSARSVQTSSKEHGAEAPRKSKLRSSGLGRPTLRKASRPRVYAVHERKSSARCHASGEEGSL